MDVFMSQWTLTFRLYNSRVDTLGGCERNQRISSNRESRDEYIADRIKIMDEEPVWAIVKRKRLTLSSRKLVCEQQDIERIEQLGGCGLKQGLEQVCALL